MKKVLSAAFISLAVCTLTVSPARSQTGNVRVGPLADDKAASTKSDEKKSPPNEASRAERKSAPAGAAKNSGSEPSSRREQARKGDAKDRETSTALTSTAATVTPTETNPSSVTSDAPSRTSDAPGVPLPVSARGASKEPGGSPDDMKGAPAPTTNASTNSTNTATRTPSMPVAASQPLTSVYRVGAGDVLDIRLLNHADPRQSTLYTVMAGGVLEYPAIADPVTVAGMTTEELAAQLVAELRHRAVYDKPQVRVSVRDYASHTVLVSGLVSDPGPKTLQREAVPLYVVVAWAQPKAEAGRAVVVSHASGKSATVDLNDATAMNMLVQQSDVVTLVTRPPEFFYTGGEINSPGQKDFHAGMTLTQAVLASGGAARPDSIRIKVSRQGADGRLVSTEYNLREIEEGKIPDPALQPGDRVEVGRYTRK
ncbi:MAG: polysaccharide biosynthesis/export family protein [Acidobacteria bacterium]|nr:polysaccharide biosynthesis/export family protein [Acidobacteriota bacterium]